jgi:hypothetical protein
MTNRRLFSEEHQASGAEYARELGQILAESKTLNWNTVVGRIGRVQSKFLDKVKRNSLQELEIKRRAREMLFLIAYLKCCPFDTCQAVFRRRCRLGFQDFESRMKIHLLYARICGRAGHYELGIRCLRRLTREILQFDPPWDQEPVDLLQSEIEDLKQKAALDTKGSRKGKFGGSAG